MKLKALSEKFEELTPEQAFQEVMAQYKNLEAYRPNDYTDLYSDAGAIIGSAQDLIDAVKQVMKVTRR